MPNTEEAIEFWKQTNLGALAVAVGSAHGMYTSEPNIKFDVLSEVSSAIPAPLVLHGGSGVSTHNIKRAIKCGVSKINVNTENQVAFTDAIRKGVAGDHAIADARLYLKNGRKAVKDMEREKIRLFRGE